MSVPRRRFLALGLQLPVSIVLAPVAFAACVDPDELPDSVLELRESLEYTDAGKSAAEACRGCSFFKADSTGGCGHCEVLRGAVSAAGHCVSWTQRV
jgi:hypothetical protein